MDALTFLGHATTLVKLENTAVLTDPVLGRRIGPLRRQGSPVGREPLEAADAVLISHLHRDHLDLPSLRQLPPTTPLIVPRGAAAIAAKAGASEILEIEVGERISVGGLTVTAVPARHDPRRWRWGPSAQPLGYLLATPRRRVYFAGDTDLFPEMSELQPLDLALLPVWGWGPSIGRGHMGPVEAARALTLLHPELAVPIHWGTFYPLGISRLRPGPLREPPLEFVRQVKAIAPEVAVRVLRPGEVLALDSSARLAETVRCTG